MRGMRIWGFLLPLGLVSTAWAVGNEAPRLELRNALVTEAKAGSSAAVSGDLYNPSAVSVTVVGADTPLAGQTLLQQYGKDSLGAKTVKVLNRIELPPKGVVALEPGQLELRLVGLNDNLRAGNELPLFFKTAGGNIQALRVVIIKGYGD